MATYRKIPVKLAKAIEKHQIWLHTNNEGGKQLNLPDFNFSRMNLEFIDFRHAILPRATFTNANVSWALFENADLTRSLFLHTTAPHAKFSNAKLVHSVFSASELSAANFSSANLDNTEFVNSDLAEANLVAAGLEGARFRTCGMLKADLAYANLTDCVLFRCDLTQAYTRGAKIYNTNFDYSSFPLHCGSFDANTDRKFMAQLAYHFCRLDCKDREVQNCQRLLTNLANDFHRVRECGEIVWKGVEGVSHDE